MRTVGRLCLVGLVLLGLNGAIRAGDREKALEIIDQAIKSHGGEAALTKTQTMIRNGTGTLSVGSGDVNFTDEATFGLPGRQKLLIKLDKIGQVIGVVNGDRGWRSAGGAVNELTKDALDEVREDVYLEWLLTLVPLKKDGFELTPVEGKMVDGKPALGVRVASKGHGDVRMYFDKNGGLLVKVERVAKEGGFAVNKEYIFGGYKDFDGVKLPTKRTELHNGKKFVELTSATYKFPSKVDDAAFGKP